MLTNFSSNCFPPLNRFVSGGSWRMGLDLAFDVSGALSLRRRRRGGNPSVPSVRPFDGGPRLSPASGSRRDAHDHLDETFPDGLASQRPSSREYFFLKKKTTKWCPASGQKRKTNKKERDEINRNRFIHSESPFQTFSWSRHS